VSWVLGTCRCAVQCPKGLTPSVSKCKCAVFASVSAFFFWRCGLSFGPCRLTLRKPNTHHLFLASPSHSKARRLSCGMSAVIKVAKTELPYPRSANYLPSLSGRSYEGRPQVSMSQDLPETPAVSVLHRYFFLLEQSVVIDADFITCNN
jgi:hypothetical protein